MTARLLRCLPFLLVLLAGPGLAAQWDPANGQWGKESPDDLRVMTWNVQDGLCSTAVKSSGHGATSWEALARVVAALRPDVLLVQEAGDNSGNGTGSGVDGPAALATTLGLFLQGGDDPFNGNQPVGQWVALYAPGFDLPYVFVSTKTDGFNRDVILSRYPFADLNGDGKSQLSDLPNIQPDLYAPGGNGGIRGYMLAEIDLPDAVYAGDLVVGNSHLKAGGDASDHAARVNAARNIAYGIDALFNGLGTGTPDPDGKIQDSPPVTALPDGATPVVTGGDWNEDEVKNGAVRGPAAWISEAELQGGTDGTDRDRTDMRLDDALDPIGGGPETEFTSKYDYIAFQDSIAVRRRAFVFDSTSLSGAAFPPELLGYPGGAVTISNKAADHRPVILDLELPLVCPPAATDLGFGKPGTGGVVPAFTACGELSTGATADLLLADAPPVVPALLVLSLTDAELPFSGGVLVPLPDVLLGPVNTDADGAIPIPGVPGGGGPVDLYAQWIVLDPGAFGGRSLSNALALHLLP